MTHATHGRKIEASHLEVEHTMEFELRGKDVVHDEKVDVTALDQDAVKSKQTIQVRERVQFHVLQYT